MKTSPRTFGRFFAAAFVCFTCALSATVAGENVVFEVPTNSITMPLAISIKSKDDREHTLQYELVELDHNGATHHSASQVQFVPAREEDGTKLNHGQQLLAILPASDTTAETRHFRLQPSANKPSNNFRFESVNEASLGLWQGEHPVLVYNHGAITDPRVPKVDHRRRRGCYIHPVWDLHGKIITDDFPKDHFHHHGIFWAWPHVRIDNIEYDLWTYSNIQQRFVRWIYRDTGPIAAVLAVENGWYVDERKVMIERVWVRIFAAQGGRRAIDISITWIPIDRAITLQGAANKSYGGLTMRFAPRDDKHTVITVPAGRTSEDLSESALAWSDYTSQFAGAETLSGATVMIDPAHPDFPPTWLTRHYGALCVGYPGVQEKTFPHGEAFTLSYRVSVHDASVQLVDLKQDYDAYTSALEASWQE
jgi:hypothetical protein